MKRERSHLARVLGIALMVGLGTPVGAEIVYDNTTNSTGSTAVDTELGDQVTLGGTARVVTDFLFLYGSTVPQTATVRFYANDGPGGQPGTLLFDSGPVALPAGGFLGKVLSGLTVPVPDTFIWTVAFSLSSGSFGLFGFDPPTIGSAGPPLVQVGFPVVHSGH